MSQKQQAAQSKAKVVKGFVTIRRGDRASNPDGTLAAHIERNRLEVECHDFKLGDFYEVSGTLNDGLLAIKRVPRNNEELRKFRFSKELYRVQTKVPNRYTTPYLSLHDRFVGYTSKGVFLFKNRPLEIHLEPNGDFTTSSIDVYGLANRGGKDIFWESKSYQIMNNVVLTPEFEAKLLPEQPPKIPGKRREWRTMLPKGEAGSAQFEKRAREHATAVEFQRQMTKVEGQQETTYAPNNVVQQVVTLPVEVPTAGNWEDSLIEYVKALNKHLQSKPDNVTDIELRIEEGRLKAILTMQLV